jgi:hypothetical protein
LDRNKNPRSEPIFEFAAFLAAAARGSVDEGGMGASLRFLDALSKFPTILPSEAIENEDDEFLKSVATFIKENMNEDFLESRDKYIELLDKVQVKFAKEIRRRYRLP